jgi:hypothetical protein
MIQHKVFSKQTFISTKRSGRLVATPALNFGHQISESSPELLALNFGHQISESSPELLAQNFELLNMNKLTRALCITEIFLCSPLKSHTTSGYHICPSDIQSIFRSVIRIIPWLSNPRSNRLSWIFPMLH